MFRRKKTKASGEINVVPYIDVMLVLLIIFMITAPKLEQGVEVDLPKTMHNESVALPEKEAVLLLSIKNDNSFHLSYLGQTFEVGDLELVKKSKAFYSSNNNSKVFIRSDKDVRYERIMTAMDLLKSSGYSKVGLITEKNNN